VTKLRHLSAQDNRAKVHNIVRDAAPEPILEGVARRVPTRLASKKTARSPADAAVKAREFFETSVAIARVFDSVGVAS
jgi:hypothetical protein